MKTLIFLGVKKIDNERIFKNKKLFLKKGGFFLPTLQNFLCRCDSALTLSLQCIDHGKLTAYYFYFFS